MIYYNYPFPRYSNNLSNPKIYFNTINQPRARSTQTIPNQNLKQLQNFTTTGQSNYYKSNPNLYSSKPQISPESNAQKLDTIKKIPNKANENPLFEILGMKLYFDDILLLCLIFFLYNEGVQDQYLFIVLILLLLS